VVIQQETLTLTDAKHDAAVGRIYCIIAVTHMNDHMMNQKVSTPSFACVTLRSRSFICVCVYLLLLKVASCEYQDGV
jgi:hypothetical protein